MLLYYHRHLVEAMRGKFQDSENFCLIANLISKFVSVNN